MSMSDDVESTNMTGKTSAGPRKPQTGAQPANGGARAAAGLPGLAAFGQMHPYAAVGQESGAPAEPAEEPGRPQGDVAEQHYEQPEQQQPEAQYAEEMAAHDAGQPYAEAEPEVQADTGYAAQAPVTAEPEAEYEGAGESYTEPYQEQAEQDAAYSYSPEELKQFLAGQGEDEVGSLDDYPQDAGDDAAHEATMAAASAGGEAEFDAGSALQTFEARYDQHPEIPLSSFDDPGEQPFYPGGGPADASFMEGDDEQEPMLPPTERKSRKVLMIASGLIGALALGGALAFVYKTGGNPQLAGGAPPLIKADNTPVKVTPQEPGGKQFPHQNKKIYDRLQGEQKPEVEKIVPRQEEVASKPAATTTGLDADKPAQPEQKVAAAQTQTSDTSGSPHKVRTLQIRPDGSVVATQLPAEQAAAPQPPAVPTLPNATQDLTAGVAVTMPDPEPAKVDQTTVASVPQTPAPAPAATAPPPAPQPQPQAAAPAPPVPSTPSPQPQAAQPQQTAAVTAPAPLPQPKPAVPATRSTTPASTAAPAQSAAKDGSIFVVQVASRRSQAMALAAFADLQQKYTSLLGNYQPMIQSADLGSKGTWYRLRVGPMSKKAEAQTLCNKLKSAGLRSCLVRPL